MAQTTLPRSLRRCALALLMALTACSSITQKAGVYQSAQVMLKMKVTEATAVAVYRVTIEASTGSPLGTAGSAIGAAASINPVSVAVGGVVGGETGKSVSGKEGVEIQYRTDDDKANLYALVQEADADNIIKAGDRIQILDGPAGQRAFKLPRAEAPAMQRERPRPRVRGHGEH